MTAADQIKRKLVRLEKEINNLEVKVKTTLKAQLREEQRVDTKLFKIMTELDALEKCVSELNTA